MKQIKIVRTGETNKEITKRNLVELDNLLDDLIYAIENKSSDERVKVIVKELNRVRVNLLSTGFFRN